MEIQYFVSIILVVVSIIGWRVADWLWLKPKRLEKCLWQQGLRGNRYRLLVGDLKDLVRLTTDAKSRPMESFNHDITPRNGEDGDGTSFDSGEDGDHGLTPMRMVGWFNSDKDGDGIMFDSGEDVDDGLTPMRMDVDDGFTLMRMVRMVRLGVTAGEDGDGIWGLIRIRLGL
ncbi:hypothetical protein ACFE04_009057 [Oxalis oulophora]